MANEYHPMAPSEVCYASYPTGYQISLTWHWLTRGMVTEHCPNVPEGGFEPGATGLEGLQMFFVFHLPLYPLCHEMVWTVSEMV